MRAEDAARKDARVAARQDAPPSARPARRADPRIAPQAPEDRQLPLAIFDQAEAEDRARRVERARAHRGRVQPSTPTRDEAPEQIRYYDRRHERAVCAIGARPRLQRQDRRAGRTTTAGALVRAHARRGRRRRSPTPGSSTRDGRMTSREVDRNRDGKRDAFYTYQADSLSAGAATTATTTARSTWSSTTRTACAWRSRKIATTTRASTSGPTTKCAATRRSLALIEARHERRRPPGRVREVFDSVERRAGARAARGRQERRRRRSDASRRSTRTEQVSSSARSATRRSCHCRRRFRRWIGFGQAFARASISSSLRWLLAEALLMVALDEQHQLPCCGRGSARARASSRCDSPDTAKSSSTIDARARAVAGQRGHAHLVAPLAHRNEASRKLPSGSRLHVGRHLLRGEVGEHRRPSTFANDAPCRNDTMSPGFCTGRNVPSVMREISVAVNGLCERSAAARRC